MKAATAACGLPPCIAVRMVANRFIRAVSSALGFTLSDDVCSSGSRSHFLPAPPRPIAAAIVEVVGSEYGTTKRTDVDFVDESCVGIEDKMRIAWPAT